MKKINRFQAKFLTFFLMIALNLIGASYLSAEEPDPSRASKLKETLNKMMLTPIKLLTFYWAFQDGPVDYEKIRNSMYELKSGNLAMYPQAQIKPP